MSTASECREMVQSGKAESLLIAMSNMLQTVGFDSMARDVKSERDFSRLQHYARIIMKHAVNGTTRESIKARFSLLGLI